MRETLFPYFLSKLWLLSNIQISRKKKKKLQYKMIFRETFLNSEEHGGKTGTLVVNKKFPRERVENKL